MGKHSKVSEAEGGEISEPQQTYLSPIAKPLFDGKLLERSVKLLKYTIEAERAGRAAAKEKKTRAPRLVRRGVAEVTKALRKGEKGIVYFAADVYPVDIIAHLPIFCEEKNITYGYLPTKQVLGAACRSTRPASVVMVTLPTEDAAQDLKDIFDKVAVAARKANPYFDD